MLNSTTKLETLEKWRRKSTLKFSEYQDSTRKVVYEALSNTSKIRLISDYDFKNLISQYVEENRYQNNGQWFIKSSRFVNHLQEVADISARASGELINKYWKLARYIHVDVNACAWKLHDIWKIFTWDHLHEIEGADWFYNRGWYYTLISNAEEIENSGNDEEKSMLEEFKKEVVKVVLTDFWIYEDLSWFWDDKRFIKGSRYYTEPVDSEGKKAFQQKKTHFLEMVKKFNTLRKILFPSLKTGNLQITTLPSTFNQIIMLYADMSTGDMSMQDRWTDMIDRYANPDGEYHDPVLLQQVENDSVKSRIFSYHALIENLLNAPDNNISEINKVIAENNISEINIIEGLMNFFNIDK